MLGVLVLAIVLIVVDIRGALHRERTAHYRICGHDAPDRDEHEDGGP